MPSTRHDQRDSNPAITSTPVHGLRLGGYAALGDSRSYVNAAVDLAGVYELTGDTRKATDARDIAEIVVRDERRYAGNSRVRWLVELDRSTAMAGE